MKPRIISVAITGSVPTQRDNPAVPITVSEQIESTQAVYEAGASICRAHVRNDDQTPSRSAAANTILGGLDERRASR